MRTCRPGPWIALSLCLAACGAPTDDTPEDTDPLVEDAPATAHWMADLFTARQDARIGELLLPGAFNSTSYACDASQGISPHAPGVVVALWGSGARADDDPNRQLVVDWARTQDRSLGQQLLDGIRFLELNVTLKDGVLTTWHSVYGVPLDEVLDEVVAFGTAWPDEVVVMTFGLDLDPADWSLLADAVTAPRADGVSLCDLLYDAPDNAALATVADLRARGRSFVWSPSGDVRAFLEARGDCALSTATLDRTWSITVSPEGVSDALEASVDTRDPEHLLINDFVFSLDGAPGVLDQAYYIGQYQGVAEASAALGFSGDFPGRMIEAHDAEGHMNVFAGAYYQDTNLVEAAIARNRTRWGDAP